MLNKKLLLLAIIIIPFQDIQSSPFSNCKTLYSLSGFSPALQNYKMTMNICKQRSSHVKIHINYQSSKKKTIVLSQKKINRLRLSIKMSMQELSQRAPSFDYCNHKATLKISFPSQKKSYSVCDTGKDYFYMKRILSIFRKTYFEQW